MRVRHCYLAIPPLLSSLISSVQSESARPCQVDGALLPRPVNLLANEDFQTATEDLKALFDGAIAGDIEGGFDTVNTSFAAAFISLQDGWPHPQRPIWNYTYLNPNNVNGTKELDGDSQWLVGSISKLYTDILFLKSGVDGRDLVTKYLPELNKTGSLINWNEVTLEDLGNHLSGMPVNYGFPEIYETLPLFQQLGFPPIEDSELPPCGIIGLSPGCTRQQILDGLTKSHPVSPVGERAVYSNLASTVLGYALHNATGMNYTELLSELVIKPLKLNNTGESPGDYRKAVIPPLMNGWGSDYGEVAPAGGLFSSINDLSAVASSILYKTLLPPAKLRRWLKPTSSTPNPNYSIGLPWEIYRPVTLTPAHPHTVDMYCKDGGAFAYISRICIIDQYGVAFVVLTAGDTEALYPIAEALVSSLLPAVENATRAEAQKYTGMYGDNVEDAPVIANLTIDDGPGLKVNDLSRNGSSILEALSVIWNYQQVSLGALSMDFRLYPSDISRSEGVGDEVVVKEDWRMAFESPDRLRMPRPNELPNNGGFAQPCTTWQTYDLLYYGGKPIDRFVFVLNATTKEVIGLELPALRANLTKEMD